VDQVQRLSGDGFSHTIFIRNNGLTTSVLLLHSLYHGSACGVSRHRLVLITATGKFSSTRTGWQEDIMPENESSHNLSLTCQWHA
jgi:hypothetical protein